MCAFLFAGFCQSASHVCWLLIFSSYAFFASPFLESNNLILAWQLVTADRFFSLRGLVVMWCDGDDSGKKLIPALQCWHKRAAASIPIKHKHTIVRGGHRNVFFFPKIHFARTQQSIRTLHYVIKLRYIYIYRYIPFLWHAISKSDGFKWSYSGIFTYRPLCTELCKKKNWMR